MKKILSVILAVMMLCTMCCFAEAGVDVLGTWYLNAIEYGEQSMHPSAMGMDMVVIINEDGTAEVAMREGTAGMAGEWTMGDGMVIITVDGSPEEFVIEGENLVVDEPAAGVRMILGKEKVEAEVVDYGEIRTDVTVEDFNGTWSSSEVEMNGVRYSIEALGLGLVVTLENGSAHVVESQGDIVIEYDAEAKLDGEVLVVKTDDENVTESTLYLKLHENDYLSFAQSTEGFSMMLYFARVDG